ncbi:heterokaryon incompatibility protein-domain-containing protein, partial [Halenospora varia]
YMCLSHCWGDSQYPSKTTNLTLNQNKANITWDSLPRTFQDAIIVTRWLKIRYLWIDSLCIIQDSKEDWEEEAPKMVDIYQRSFLTIAATSSPSDDGGCFSKISLESHSPDGKPYDFYYRTPLRHLTLGSDLDTKSGKSEAPLLGRSWCYQEILLSPRVLHFFKDEITWECMEDAACECAGQTSPLHPSREETPPKIHQSQSLERSAAALQERWRKIVVEYSGLGLSFGKDKFPALSGLAKQQLYRPNESFVAGLWTGSLLEDLLWRVEKAESEDQRQQKPSWRPTLWRAPTWSW